MIIAQISTIPIGTGSTSVSNFVVEAVKALRSSGLKAMVTPMGTVIEAEDLDRLFKAVERCHEVLHRAGVKRIYTTIFIDDRRDVERSMLDKVKSIEERLSREPNLHSVVNNCEQL
jgi:uncharacterized protein (TIGR00106 family)